MPQPEGWARYAADVQRGDPGSTLSLCRGALAQRRCLDLGDGALAWEDGYGDDVVAFTVTTTEATVLVLATTGGPVELPAGEVLLASAATADGTLPGDSSAWIVLR